MSGDDHSQFNQPTAVQDLARYTTALTVEDYFEAAWCEELGIKRAKPPHGLKGCLSAGVSKAWEFSSRKRELARSRKLLVVDRPSLTSPKWRTLPEHVVEEVLNQLLRSLPPWKRWHYRLHIIAALNKHFYRWASRHPDCRAIVSTADPDTVVDFGVHALRASYSVIMSSPPRIPFALANLRELRCLSLSWHGYEWPPLNTADPSTATPALVQPPLMLPHLVSLSLSVFANSSDEFWLHNLLRACPSLKTLRPFIFAGQRARQYLPPFAPPAPFDLRLLILRGSANCNFINDDLMMWLLTGTTAGGCKVVTDDVRWPCVVITAPADRAGPQNVAAAAIRELAFIATSLTWSFRSYEFANLTTLRIFQLIVSAKGTFWRVIDQFPCLEVLAIGLVTGEGSSSAVAFVEDFRQRISDAPVRLKRLEIDDDRRTWRPHLKQALQEAAKALGVAVVWQPMGSSIAPEFLHAMWEVDEGLTL